MIELINDRKALAIKKSESWQFGVFWSFSLSLMQITMNWFNELSCRITVVHLGSKKPYQ